jgi:hypothetical protein
MLILVAEQVKFSYKILYQNRPVCWSIVVKGKPTVGSSSFWTLPSDRIPRTTKHINA